MAQRHRYTLDEVVQWLSSILCTCLCLHAFMPSSMYACLLASLSHNGHEAPTADAGTDKVFTKPPDKPAPIIASTPAHASHLMHSLSTRASALLISCYVSRCKKLQRAWLTEHILCNLISLTVAWGCNAQEVLNAVSCLTALRSARGHT